MVGVGLRQVAGQAASMRPRLISRGNAQAGVKNVATDALASMRPRLISRGNLSHAGKFVRAQTASMRPRLISRGNIGTPCAMRCCMFSYNAAADIYSRNLPDALPN